MTDLIDRLTDWVLRTALRETESLRGADTLAVAVNVSARTISRPSFADEVIQILKALERGETESALGVLRTYGSYGALAGPGVVAYDRLGRSCRLTSPVSR